MLLERKKVAVVGMGASGASAALLCAAKGAHVVGFDEARVEQLAAARGLCGVELVSEKFREGMLAGFDLVIVSPGVPRNEAISQAERAGIEIIGELELASRFITAPIALIGGTNGKSTVTALVAAILEAAGKKVFCGGNFGTPLCDAAGASSRPSGCEPNSTVDVCVVEISSFQAERVPTLHAKAHALLNITDDHLDRYDSFEAYANAKGNPFVTMGRQDIAVIPYGDLLCSRQAARGGARIVTFSAADARASIRVEAHRLVGVSVQIERAALKLAGQHNLANACAAIGVAEPFLVDSADPSAIVERAFRGFTGLGHRCALVRELGGVRYYDDSKGTNVGASVAALAGLTEDKAVLIAGGRDKFGAYEPLVGALRKKGRALVVIGEAADRIAAAASGVLPIERARSMPQAVQMAAKMAQPGDAVLLSPACSSFDMFDNYKQRGDAFVAAVRRLGGGG